MVMLVYSTSGAVDCHWNSCIHKRLLINAYALVLEVIGGFELKNQNYIMLKMQEISYRTNIMTYNYNDNYNHYDIMTIRTTNIILTILALK